MTDLPATAPWRSLHLFLHCGTEDTDAVITEDLAPLLDGWVAGGRAADWFFIRYGEGGPHLRVRVRGLAAADQAELGAALERFAKERPAVAGPWPSGHGELREVPYRPETQRYGGAAALPVAEEVFVASTRTAVTALRRLPSGEQRLAVAADLAQATAFALGMDRLAAAGWLRRLAAGWRWVEEVDLLPGSVVHAKVNAVFAGQHRALVQRAEAVREVLARGAAQPWLAAWAEAVREADGRLRAAADVREGGLPWVWSSQLHMLFNRLGVTPDEERAVCRLAARALMDGGEPPSFFPVGHRAPDRQYLERSKFQIGRTEDTALRSAPPRREVPGLPELALPAGPLPEVSLASVLASRRSARGRLTGPLDAAGLGTLLWSAHAESHRSEQRLVDGSVRPLRHRAYPSAGALYTARLRLFAFAVDGVPPGTYEVAPERRALRRIGPAPEPAELRALSSYLSRPEGDPDGIGVEEVPAVLGLYLDLGQLRQRYGLRALRLGLLEAGHLAQALVLTATALELGTGTLGGFHDDLAHELFGLDDLDQPLQYLMPVGRAEADGVPG
ncbi:thiopeptide-type bacteriocin biosynthesis protein [Kitasatospora camelliae]|uniref:Thiopeptide-type bacteriocin biosynthesis protein n=1 Tax=Kitasatospora camelliae TaxID=3156397 RepID=A0AAU8K6Q4_9ACTN